MQVLYEKSQFFYQPRFISETIQDIATGTMQDE